MGLPEVLFGLFPGMGAYSFLCQRVAPQHGRKDDARRHDVQQRRTAPHGRGRRARAQGRRRARRAGSDPPATAASRTPALAMHQVRAIAQPVGYDELMRITEIWVDTALAAGRKVAADDGPAGPRAGRAGPARRRPDGCGSGRAFAAVDHGARTLARVQDRPALRQAFAQAAQARGAIRAQPASPASRISSPPTAASLTRPRLLATPLSACACSRTASQSPASPACVQRCEAGLGVAQALRDESALEGVAHAQRAQFVQDRAVEHVLADRRGAARRLANERLICPLAAMSASVSSRRASTTGLARKARAPACSQALDRIGRDVGAEHDHRRARPPPASMTRNCLQQVQAADAGHVQVDDHGVVVGRRQQRRAPPRRRRR